jgi:class 3 adenylate cyclase
MDIRISKDTSPLAKQHVAAAGGADLPVGTITFLMTDIEGSTRVWDASPQLAKVGLQRHDRIVLEHIEQNQGQTVEAGREGDSVLAVFRQARDAVTCALDMQRSLQREVWPVGADMRVRIAVHTGEAELRSAHYVGAPLYRCARLMATAHGGQVLISRATEELVADSLPEGVTLRDLGRHRLRDLSRPEHVYQLLHRDLPADFPPLKSLDEPRTNLAQQLTSFVGRQGELGSLKKLIKESRLITLVGAGGIGKSRLAIQLAPGTMDR